MKVIFVCLGNICRSPMTEAMFKKWLQKLALLIKLLLIQLEQVTLQKVHLLIVEQKPFSINITLKTTE